MRSRKSSIIWDIFHTDNSSALQDIWEIRRMAWNSANLPNDMKFGEFAEWHEIRRIRRILCFMKRWESVANVVFQAVVYGWLTTSWLDGQEVHTNHLSGYKTTGADSALLSHGLWQKHQGKVDLATHSTGEDRAPSSSSPSLPRQSWRTHWSGTWLCSWRRWGHCWLTLWPRTKTQHGGGIQVVVGGWLVVVGGGWWLGWFIPIS